jgi:DNA polymerase-3 subunit gamma/tau
MRDGLSLLDQVIAACGNQLEETRVRQVLGVVPARLLNSVLEAIHAGDSRRVLELLGQLATEGYEPAHFCAELTRTVRNLMVAKSCGAESPLVQVASEERARLAELAKLFGEEDLARFFNLLLRTESEMRYSLQPRFHLELGLMKLVHARRLAPLEGLLAQLAPPRHPIVPSSESRGIWGGGPGEMSMQRGANNLGTTPVRSLPPKTPAAPPQESVESAAAPAPPSMPISAPPETRTTTSVAPRGGSAPVASPEATVETVRPEAPVSQPGEDARLSSIKAVLFNQSKRFLSSCLDHLAGFRFENGEARFAFKHKDSLYAELLKAREQQEALRAACAQVLGQAVRIYVTLEGQGTEAQVPRLSARERAEHDPGVEAFKKKFDGTLVDVQDLSQE